MPTGHYQRRCQFCEHPDRQRIEFLLAVGKAQKHLAREFKLPPECVHRHWEKHVSTTQKAEMLGGRAAVANLAERSRAEDRSLLDYAAILRSSLLRLFLDAQKRGLAYDAAIVAQRLLNVLEFSGTGELRQQAAIQINNNVAGGPTLVMNSPEAIQVQFDDYSRAARLP